MGMNLRVDPSDAVPIWKQVEDGVRRLVASGALERGGSVPSVRELARDLRVNPATIAKAYQRLTEAGVLMVRRGEGTFVADAPPAMVRSERRRTLAASAGRYAAVAFTIGATLEEATGELDTVWEKLDRSAAKGGNG